MPNTHIALIAPAMSDVAGQCHIVYREVGNFNALRDYRANPDAWRQCGIMNSHGELVCCDKLGNLETELKSLGTLAAGYQVPFDIDAVP